MSPEVFISVLFLSGVCYWIGYRLGVKDSHKEVDEKADEVLQICLLLLDELSPEDAKKLRAGIEAKS